MLYCLSADQCISMEKRKINFLKDKKLLEACKANNVACIDALLKAPKNLDFNKADCFGKTAIYYAIENRSLQALKLLVSSGADLHKTSLVTIRAFSSISKEAFIKYHEPPLVTAARTSDLLCLQLLLDSGCSGGEFASVVVDEHTPKDGLEESVLGGSRCYAVHHAVIRNQPLLLRELLENGASAEVRDHDEKTPMHYATMCRKESPSSCSQRVQMLQLLLLHTGNPHVADRLSVTPLALAINYECLASVECLLSAGPSPPYQLSMVGLATLKNRYDMVVRLVKAGFGLNLLNSRFQTPLQTDIFYQPVGKIAGILIYHGCDVNCSTRPLHMASLLYQMMKSVRLDCETLAFFIVKTGYNLNQDPWLLEQTVTDCIEACVSKTDAPTARSFFSSKTLMKYGSFKAFPISSKRMLVLMQYLLQQLCKPMKLVELCRVAIRKRISFCNGGLSVVKSLQGLPLPTPLVSFLLFADIATELSDGSIVLQYPL